MYAFKSMADLQKVPLDHPCRGFVLKLVCTMVLGGSGYNPASDGYAVLIEPQDLSLQELLPEVPLPLSQMPWEDFLLGNVCCRTLNGICFSSAVKSENDPQETLRRCFQVVSEE